MFKKLLFALFLMFFSGPLFCASFNFSSENSEKIYAYDNEFGKILDTNKSDLVIKLENSLKDDFSPQWIEEFVKQENLYGFSKSYSIKLKEILPITLPYYIIEPIINSNEIQIAVRCSNNKIIKFIFDDNKYLVAITMK